YALAAPSVNGIGSVDLYASSDGARTFGPPLYTPPLGSTLSGVEAAASDGATIYATLYQTAPVHPFVLRTEDGGATFESFDVLPAVGPHSIRLAAVDPVDRKTLYLRVLDPQGGDKLAISTDGGATARIALGLGANMSAFLRQADGSLLV